MVRQRQTLRRGASLIVAVALAMPVVLSAGTFASAATPSKGGPLTPRLQLLAQPTFEALSPQAQAQKLVLPASGPGSIMERPGGRILVDIRVTDTAAGTLERLKAAGSQLVYVDDALRIVTAEVAPTRLTDLAAVQPEVLSVQEVLQPMVNAACPTGDFVSEGDTQLNAATGRTNHAVNGAGITVGVMSDSYNNLGGAATDVTNGELPGASNPCGFTTPVTVQADSGTTDEGRAMTQIVHDLAPGSNLRFATANNGEAAFATQIRNLATAGAKVIVDDVTYFAEPMYQDGVVGKAVEDVSAAGVAYFSSAGNENLILGGNNVASYETQTYRPTTCPASVIAFESVLDCHDFNPTVTVDNTYGLTFTSSLFYVMGWNEPQFGITTDLDFCVLLHSNGSLIGCSAADNLVTQKAFEALSVSGSGTVDLVVARFAGTGTPRFKFISEGSSLSAVEYATGAMGDVVGPTIFGHNASRAGATVAAIPFNNSATLETYSSRGPATYCWGPVVGTVPATALGSCETATVDMSATDGVQNSFFGGGSPHRFFGTSAAAPHAAAIAALVLQASPCLTSAQVLTAMKTGALSVGAFGVDAMGAGRLDANAGIGAAGVGTCPTPTITSITPVRGPAAGGTTVTITGTGFTGATAVHFGATAAPSFTVYSDVEIRAVSPAGAGTVDVTVTTPGGTSTTSSADHFTYIRFVAADFNGNGSTDIAVYRPSEGRWYINGQGNTQFGTSTDIPVPADYNGDGTTDIAIYRPSEGRWYINGQGNTQFGTSTDIPVPADYNGDGTTDIAIYRPSEGRWYINGQGNTQFGTSTDIPVPADYNGDGTTDIAIYRPSEGRWYINGQGNTQFGTSTDRPEPGDYNGNGTTDIAIYRPSEGRWYINGQGNIQFGTSTDIPLVLPVAVRLRFFP